MQDKKIIAVTLARSGSKSIKDKNLAIVNKKSLLQRAIESSKDSKYIKKHFVSSDSEKYLKIAEELGAIPVLRPSQLATDNSSSADAIINVVEQIEDKPDIIVELMCTNPFKTSLDVDNCIEKLLSTGADSVVSVVRVLDNHPSRVKYIQNDELVDFFPEPKEKRRQDLEPHAYVRNGSIYCFTYESLIGYKSRYGGVVRPYILDYNKSVNIDEYNDILLARLIGEKYEI